MLEIPRDVLKESGMCEHGNWKHCRFCVETESPLAVNEDEQVFLASRALEKTIGVGVPLELVYSSDLKDLVGNMLIKAVEELPELIGEKLGLDFHVFGEKATNIIDSLRLEDEIGIRSDKQVELIFTYLAMITRVQGKTDDAFTPELAKERAEINSTLGCWSLKQKLESSGVEDVSFDFGYTPNQEVGVVRIANGKTLYVDTRTGFVAEITLQEKKKEESDASVASLYDVLSLSPILNPDESPKPGIEKVPTQMRIEHNGTLQWLGKLALLSDTESSMYTSDTATQFRDAIENDAKKANAIRTIITAAQTHTQKNFTFPQTKTPD